MIVFQGQAWAQAANLERQRQQRELEELQRKQQEEIDRRRQPDQKPLTEDAAPAEKAAPKGSDVEFDINRIEVTPSEVLDESELRSILAPLEGRRGSVQEIFDAVEKINKLYKDKNYLACRALLPRQKIENGVVKITLIEGRVGEIRVNNNPSTNSNYIADRITNQPGELVELGELESSLAYFNQTNDISLRAVLSPGAAVGTTDFVIEAQEPADEEFQLSMDNTGTNDSGLARVGLNYTNRSIFGRRDRFVTGVNISEGSQFFYLSYEAPINKKGTRFGGSFDFSKVKIIDGPLEPLDVESESENFSLNLTHPIVVNEDWTAHVFALAWRKHSTTDFDDVRLFETDVDSMEFGFDAQSYTAGGSWYTRHSVTAGQYESVKDSNYWRYNFYGNWLRIFENNTMLTLRASGQYSPEDLLPSSEQFQIGGLYTVRGYKEGLLRGDSGYTLSAEYELPGSSEGTLPGSNPFTDNWRTFFFVDHGGTFPFKGDDEGTDEDDYLTSVGVGLSLNFGNAFQGRFVVGVPLFDRDDGEDDITVHFRIWRTEQ